MTAWGTFFARVGIMSLFFIIGCAEAWLYKRRDIACVTWVSGLLPLLVWIAYPLTLFRLGLSVVVLLGAILLIWRYWQRGRDSSVDI